MLFTVCATDGADSADGEKSPGGMGSGGGKSNGGGQSSKMKNGCSNRAMLIASIFTSGANILTVASLIVTIVFGLIKLDQYRKSERRHYTFEMAQRIQTSEHIKTLARIDALAEAFISGQKLDAELFGLLYPKASCNLARRNMVVDDLNSVLMTYSNASFLCQERFADQEILIRYFSSVVYKFVFNLSILGEWDSGIQEILPAMQDNLAPFMQPVAL